MNGIRKIAVIRTVYISVMIILTGALIVLCSILKTDAAYSAGLIKPEPSPSDRPNTAIESITEPDFSYERVKLTFAGSVTAGSMLGSDSFGTLNSLYNENGAEYFLSDITSVTNRDDITFAFLSSVFSDSESLTPLEKGEDEKKEWYKAPSGMAQILSLGGIDAVSIENIGAKSYGTDGYADTKKSLDDSHVMWGDSGKAIYKTADCGLKIAIYPCAYREENILGIISWIENASSSNDYVVICISGNEENTVSESTEKAYRSFIDAGADLVVGTNYTNLLKTEEYNGGFIAYSLGSLIDGKDKYSEKYTALLDVEIHLSNGGISEVNYEPIPLIAYSDSNSWHPKLISEGEEYDLVMSCLLGSSSEK